MSRSVAHQFIDPDDTLGDDTTIPRENAQDRPSTSKLIGPGQCDRLRQMHNPVHKTSQRYQINKTQLHHISLAISLHSSLVESIVSRFLGLLQPFSFLGRACSVVAPSSNTFRFRSQRSINIIGTTRYLPLQHHWNHKISSSSGTCSSITP